MNDKTMVPATGRRGFLRLSALNVAAPVAGVMLGACGGNSSSAVAQPTSDAIKFDNVLPGTRSTAVSADGTRIAINEYGNPSGRPVLLVHGFSQSHLCWQKQFQDVGLASRYRICTMDLRGHGESDKPIGPYTVANQADDIHAVIQKLRLNNVALVGWSLGGLVILDYLSIFGTSGISKVMFVDAGYGNSSTPGARQQFGSGLTDNVPPMLSSDAAENVNGTLKFLQACSYLPLSNSDLAFALAYNMLTTPQSRQATLDGRPKTPEDYDKNVMVSLARSGLPVIALTGGQDNIVLPFAARDISVATGGRLVVYENTGHTPFIEAPGRFNSDLLAFLG